MALNRVGQSHLMGGGPFIEHPGNPFLAEKVDACVTGSLEKQPPALIPRGINVLSNESSPKEAMQIMHELPQNVFSAISNRSQDLDLRTQTLINHVARDQKWQEDKKQLGIRGENLEQMLQATSLLEKESESLTSDISTREAQLVEAGQSNQEMKENLNAKQNELEKSARELKEQRKKEKELQRTEQLLKQSIESKEKEEAEIKVRADATKKKLDAVQNAGGICLLF